MGMIPRDEELKLIRRARRGDGAAIESLIRAHQDALYAFLLRMSGRPDVAEDIAQEAFVRVLRNIDRFDDRFRFSTWLFTIAKRLYINAMQKLKPTYDSEALGGREGRPNPPGQGMEDREATANAREIIDIALDALSEQQREIVLLFHQQTWSIGEIARMLGMPEGTVKSHLHRARLHMRRVIAADEVLLRHSEEVLA